MPIYTLSIRGKEVEVEAPTPELAAKGAKKHLDSLQTKESKVSDIVQSTMNPVEKAAAYGLDGQSPLSVSRMGTMAPEPTATTEQIDNSAVSRYGAGSELGKESMMQSVKQMFTDTESPEYLKLSQEEADRQAKIKELGTAGELGSAMAPVTTAAEIAVPWNLAGKDTLIGKGISTIGEKLQPFRRFLKGGTVDAAGKVIKQKGATALAKRSAKIGTVGVGAGYVGDKVLNPVAARNEQELQQQLGKRDITKNFDLSNPTIKSMLVQGTINATLPILGRTADVLLDKAALTKLEGTKVGRLLGLTARKDSAAQEALRSAWEKTESRINEVRKANGEAPLAPEMLGNIKASLAEIDRLKAKYPDSAPNLLSPELADNKEMMSFLTQYLDNASINGIATLTGKTSEEIAKIIVANKGASKSVREAAAGELGKLAKETEDELANVTRLQRELENTKKASAELGLTTDLKTAKAPEEILPTTTLPAGKVPSGDTREVLQAGAVQKLAELKKTKNENFKALSDSLATTPVSLAEVRGFVDEAINASPVNADIIRHEIPGILGKEVQELSEFPATYKDLNDLYTRLDNTVDAGYLGDDAAKNAAAAIAPIRDKVKDLMERVGEEASASNPAVSELYNKAWGYYKDIYLPRTTAPVPGGSATGAMSEAASLASTSPNKILKLSKVDSMLKTKRGVDDYLRLNPEAKDTIHRYYYSQLNNMSQKGVVTQKVVDSFKKKFSDALSHPDMEDVNTTLAVLESSLARGEKANADAIERFNTALLRERQAKSSQKYAAETSIIDLESSLARSQESLAKLRATVVDPVKKDIAEKLGTPAYVDSLWNNPEKMKEVVDVAKSYEALPDLQNVLRANIESRLLTKKGATTTLKEDADTLQTLIDDYSKNKEAFDIAFPDNMGEPVIDALKLMKKKLDVKTSGAEVDLPKSKLSTILELLAISFNGASASQAYRASNIAGAMANSAVTDTAYKVLTDPDFAAKFITNNLAPTKTSIDDVLNSLEMSLGIAGAEGKSLTPLGYVAPGENDETNTFWDSNGDSPDSSTNNDDFWDTEGEGMPPGKAPEGVAPTTEVRPQTKLEDLAPQQQQVVELAQKSAARAKVDQKGFVNTLAIESSLGQDTSNPDSNATGVGQIMPDTWRGFVKKYGTAAGVTESMINNPEANIKLAAFVYKDAINDVKSVIKRDPNPAEAYMGYKLGGPNTRTFFTLLQSNPKATPAKYIVAAANSNPQFFYEDGTTNSRPLTAQEVYQRYVKRYKEKAVV